MVNSAEVEYNWLSQFQLPTELLGCTHFEVGLSGGLDSVALLHLLWAHRAPDWQISAVHVHHGLSPNADEWEEACRQLCLTMQIPLRVAHVHVDRMSASGLEAEARRQRYAVYQQSLAQVVVLAHHLDDQVETVMLQLLRGGGVHALSAMPIVRTLAASSAKIPIWRPLLTVPRSLLEHYACQQSLPWVQDESNHDIRWRRNLIRHKLFPVLEKTLPDYRKHIARSAQLLADAASIVDEVAQSDLIQCWTPLGLGLASFRALSVSRQRHVFLAWLRHLNWSLPEPAALFEFLRQIHQASCPVLSFPQGQIYAYRHWIQALSTLPAPEVFPLPSFHQDQAISCPAWGGRLLWQQRPNGLDATVLNQPLYLQPRRGGERLAAGVGHKRVKQYFQEADIAPILRVRWPLLYSESGVLLAIPGVAVNQQKTSQLGWWPEWQPDIACGDYLSENDAGK